MVCLFIETYTKLIIYFAKFAKNSNAQAYVVNHIFFNFFSIIISMRLLCSMHRKPHT